MIHTLVIPDFVPTSLNKLTRGKRRDRIALAKSDKDIIAYYASFAVLRAMCKRRVSLAISGTRADPDAFWKSTLDALVACRLLIDDNSKWCELGGVHVEGGRVRRTVITLEDL